MNKKLIFIESFISLFLVLFLWDTIFLKPLQIFAIGVHESLHGLAALLTGGKIHSMNLNFNSGTLYSSGGLFFIISSAGYVGTALVSGLLIYSSFIKKEKIILFSIALFTILISLKSINSIFSIPLLITVIIGLLIIYAVLKNIYTNYLSSFLGVFFAFTSLSDMRVYLLAIPTQTDAGILARYLGSELLTLPIGLFFFSFSMFILYKSIKLGIRNSENLL